MILPVVVMGSLPVKVPYVRKPASWLTATSMAPGRMEFPFAQRERPREDWERGRESVIPFENVWAYLIDTQVEMADGHHPHSFHTRNWAEVEGLCWTHTMVE